MQKRILFIVQVLLFPILVFAQAPYPVNYFGSPVKCDMALVGNFGEIRPNHLHAGFDIKTNCQEGMPIYAVADGYISRIKIGPKGYGKVLYLNHPNGYTSVYAHLQSFNGAIGITAKRIQYANELFEIDTLLNPTAIPVKKGDLIALSGNSGSSEGPHLHFEIRDTKTEMPINPYFFGYSIKDNVKPRITEVAIYPMGKTSTVNGKRVPQKLKPIANKLGYAFKLSDSVLVHGDIGFGIECYDSETGSTNQNAVFSIEVQYLGKRIYYSELEKFTFENARYVNAHVDYAEKQKHNNKIQKCFLAKNNQLGIYKDLANNGIISFTDDVSHWVKFIVKDFSGNTAELILKVKSTSKAPLPETQENKKEICFDCLKDNQYKKEDIEITVPASSLYDDLKFKIQTSPAVKGTYSLLYTIQDANTALQKAYNISIKAVNLPKALQSKALIISINDKGKRNNEGGVYADGWVRTQTKVFGKFAIALDTVAPVIKPVFKVTDKSNVNLKKAKTISFKVSDNLSGLKKYRATIDGKWVLCEYDLKRDLLFYEFDAAILLGKHSFRLEVSDEKNNNAVWSCNFLR